MIWAAEEKLCMCLCFYRSIITKILLRLENCVLVENLKLIFGGWISWSLGTKEAFAVGPRKSVESFLTLKSPCIILKVSSYFAGNWVPVYCRDWSANRIKSQCAVRAGRSTETPWGAKCRICGVFVFISMLCACNWNSVYACCWWSMNLKCLCDTGYTFGAEAEICNIWGFHGHPVKATCLLACVAGFVFLRRFGGT